MATNIGLSQLGEATRHPLGDGSKPRDVIELYYPSEAPNRANGAGRDFIFVNADRAEASGHFTLASHLIAEEDGPASDIESELTSALDAQISQLQAEIGKIKDASASMDGSSADISAMEEQIQKLEGLKEYVQKANPRQLQALKSTLIGPMGSVSSSTLSAISQSSIQSIVSLSEQLGEHTDHYIEMSQKWSQSFKKDLSAFEKNVAERGINHALKESNYSYHNPGVAHMYMWKNQPEYRKTYMELDKRAKDRNAEAKPDVDFTNQAIAQHDLKSPEINDLQKQITELEGKIKQDETNPQGHMKNQHQAELDAARLRLMTQTQAGLQQKLDTPGAVTDPAQRTRIQNDITQIESKIPAQQQRAQESMKDWDTAVDAHVKGLEKLGVDPKEIEKVKETYAKERTILEKSAQAGEVDLIKNKVNYRISKVESDLAAQQSETGGTQDKLATGVVSPPVKFNNAALSFLSKKIPAAESQTNTPSESVTQKPEETQKSENKSADKKDSALEAVAALKTKVSVEGEAKQHDGPSSTPNTKAVAGNTHEKAAKGIA